MKITETHLRSIIRSELRLIRESNDEAAPGSLKSFCAAMINQFKELSKIDAKEAKLDGSQLKQYFKQISDIIDSMKSSEKTSASQTAKVGKAVEG